MFFFFLQACGSGGTTAGLALGSRLSGMGARVWAYGVCDDPEYFYSFIQGLLDEAGASQDVVGKRLRARCWQETDTSCRASKKSSIRGMHSSACVLARRRPLL